MTYTYHEESEEDGTPVTLFFIRYGDLPTDVWLYCDADAPVVLHGRSYQPVTIGHSDMEQAGALDDTALNIQIAPDSELAVRYRTRAPRKKVFLTIYQGHLTDRQREFRTAWRGHIVSVRDTDRFSIISAQRSIVALQRSGIQRYYQYGCPWALYSPECGADQNAARRDTTISHVGVNFLRLPNGWMGSFTADNFRNGFIRWVNPEGATEHRSIVNITPRDSGDLITVRDTEGMAVGDNVTVYLGCNRRESDCQNLHNNIVNFGGQPWIPNQNPVGFVNLYY